MKLPIRSFATAAPSVSNGSFKYSPQSFTSQFEQLVECEKASLSAYLIIKKKCGLNEKTESYVSIFYTWDRIC